MLKFTNSVDNRLRATVRVAHRVGREELAAAAMDLLGSTDRLTRTSVEQSLRYNLEIGLYTDYDDFTAEQWDEALAEVDRLYPELGGRPTA